MSGTFYDAPREIYSVSEAMARIRVISEVEEDFYSEIPRWEGMVLSWTGSAVLLKLPHKDRTSRDNWFPYSTLRKAEDDHSVYASNWILRKKGL